MSNMIRTLVFMILFLSVPSFAGASGSFEFSKYDLAIEGAAMGLNIVDWGQTLDISKSRGYYYETNPLLGRHPGAGRINLFFVGKLLAHPTIAYILPDPYKKIWEVVEAGIELATVQNNFRIGLKVNF